MAPEEALSEILHVCAILYPFYSADIQPILSYIDDFITWLFLSMINIVLSLSLSSSNLAEPLIKKTQFYDLFIIPFFLLDG